MRARIPVAAVACFAALLLAACSSSGSNGNSGSANNGSSGNSGSTGLVALKTQKIGVVGASNQSTIVVRYEDDAVAAAKILGWSTVIEDGNNTPSLWDNELQDLVTQHVSAILTVGIDATTAESQLMAAKAAGIPVIAIGVTVNPQSAHLFAGTYQDSSNAKGSTLAAYILKKDPHATVVAQNLTVSYSASEFIASFEQSLKSGGGTVLATQDDSAANPAQSFAASAVSLVRSHPGVDFLVGCCDFTSAIDIPALQQAGLLKHVTVAETFDDPLTLQQIRQGQPVISVAVNNEQTIVDAIGALAAYFANHTAIPFTDASYQPIAQVIDKTNVPAGSRLYSFTQMLNTAKATWAKEYKLP
jgi:ABC-type sugar transport system substrate-binding protein